MRTSFMTACFSAVTLVIAGCGSEATVTPQAGSSGAGGVLTGASASSGAGGGAVTSAVSGSGSSSATTSATGGDPPPPFTCAGKGQASGTDVVTLDWGGLARAALVHVPPGYDPAKGQMLVLNFHGFSSDAPQEALLSKMSEAADERGFLVVYPYGVLTSWNAGQCCGTAWADAVDDVGFVRALVEQLAEDYCVDPRRVFSTGMSNGGFLSHRLGCEMSDVFAAIAPVAGVLGVPASECNPGRPVPIIDFHGTLDPLVPFSGGVPVVQWDTGGLIDFPSVDDSMKVWRAIDGCDEAFETSYQQGDSTCVSFLGCDEGSEVIRCVAEGAGHTWPGGMPIPPLGVTTTDMDATAMMLDFFEQHPMP